MHVSLTLSTLPLLCLAAVAWYFAKCQFLPAVMFMSVFQAASVLNVGVGSIQFGVAPSYLLLLIAIVSKFGLEGKRKGRMGPFPKRATYLLTAFVLYATVSAFVSPFVFRGVLITNVKMGSGVPLQWSSAYLTQVFYLLVSFALYIVACRRTSPVELTASLTWYINGAVLASLIGIYQFAAVRIGLPFPGQLFFTNPTYSILEPTDINGFLRINSTFTEASVAAFYLSVALAMVLARILYNAGTLRSLAQAAVITLCLILTLSSSGYLCLIFLGSLTIYVYLFRWIGSARFKANKVLVLIPLGLSVLLLFLIPAVKESIANLVQTVLIDKSQSDSYRLRNSMNDDAMQTAADTFWIGAGWGTCRASSFVYTTLANVGIPGFSLFCTFCLRLLLPMRRLTTIKLPVHAAVLFGLSTALVSLAVAIPDIVQPIIWLLFALAAKLAVWHPVLNRPTIHQSALYARSLTLNDVDSHPQSSPARLQQAKCL